MFGTSEKKRIYNNKPQAGAAMIDCLMIGAAMIDCLMIGAAMT